MRVPAPAPAHHAVLRAVVADGLSRSGLSMPADPLPEPAWRALVAAVSATRSEGHLARAAGAGTLPCTGEQLDEVVELHAGAMAACLRLEELLLAVTDRFERSGIEHRVLKGSAVAHLDYEDPALRSFGDVDLLVRPEHVDAAVAVLTEMGHRRHYPQPRPGFDRRFTKSVTLSNAVGLELDLHRTLAEGPFGVWIDLDGLWSCAEPFELAGRQLRALGRTERFVHAAYHAVLGDPVPRLTALRDLATMLDDVTLVDEAQARATVEGWRGEPVLARALVSVVEAFALDDDGHGLLRWATGFTPTRRQERSLLPYVSDRSGGYAVRALATTRALPGVRTRLAYLWALGFPEQRYVRARHTSRTRRYWSALRAWLQNRKVARSRR